MKKYAFIAVSLLFFTCVLRAEQTPNEVIRELAYEGEKLYRAGDYRNAIKKWEKGIDIARTMESQKLTTYFLANLAVVYVDLGDYKKALVYDEEALKIARILNDRNQIGNILGNLGNINGMLGSYQKALSYYEEALAVFREIGFKQGIATVIGSMGNIHSNLGEFQKALSLNKQSLELRRELNDKNGIADTLSNTGVVYKTMGDYRKAVSYYEDALLIAKENNYQQGISVNLSNLGVACDNAGDYRKALTYHEEVLKLAKLSGDQNSIGVSLANLGIVYKNLGDYRKALDYLDRALRYFKSTGYTQKIMEAINALGTLYKDLGDHKKALSYYEDAIKISRDIGYKQGMASALMNAGAVYADAGEYKEALLKYNEALGIQKQMNVPTYDVELSIADMNSYMGRLDTAEEEYNRLGNPGRLGRLNLIKKNYQLALDYYNNLLPYDQNSMELAFLFADYCGLGMGSLGLAKYEKAVEYFGKAIELVENQREALGPGERIHFFNAKIECFRRTEPYEMMVQAKIALNQPDNAFYFSESLKSRTLSEAMARGQSTFVPELPSELAKEEENHLLKMRSLRKEMIELYRNKAMDAYKDREKELRSEKASFDRFLTGLRKQYPQYASITYPKPLMPNDIDLQDHEVLIEFEITDDALYIFVLKGGYKILTVTAVQKSRKEIEDLVLHYKSYFDNIDKESDLASYNPNKGKELYNILLSGILPTIPQWMTLIIVPDEILGILPFESLPIKAPEEVKMAQGKHGPFPFGTIYLGDKYSVSYAQSAASLTILRSVKKSVITDNMALAVCDPVFSARDRRLTVNEKGAGDEEAGRVMKLVSDWKKMGVAGTRGTGQSGQEQTTEELFPRLEKTQSIAANIENLFNTRSTLLTGQYAKEESVKQLNYLKYKYVIFATHAILDNSLPWIGQPALVLSQVGNSEGNDGFLTMSEVMNMKIPSDIVALTACQTGVGKNIMGEGVMGMGRAFQYAGCNHVLMSLWPVSEDATVTLANIFFKKIKEGRELREALRLARTEMRLNGYEHPYYWAGFILVSK